MAHLSEIMAFCEAVRSKRQDLGLSRAEAAERTGIPAQNWWRIEAQHNLGHVPTEATRAKLEALLGKLPPVSRPERETRAASSYDLAVEPTARLLLALFFPGRHANAWPHLKWQAEQILALTRRLDGHKAQDATPDP